MPRTEFPHDQSLRKLKRRRRFLKRSIRKARIRKARFVATRRSRKRIGQVNGFITKRKKQLREVQAEIRHRRNVLKRAKKGNVVVLPGANRAGVGIQQIAMEFLQAVARELGGKVTVSTGTNHNRLTTSGSVSDHWDGHAGDCGISWNNGDNLAAAALRTCGYSRLSAWWMARRGGLYNCSWRGHRVQVIWKTYIGGNHFNHVHLGCR